MPAPYPYCSAVSPSAPFIVSDAKLTLLGTLILSDDCSRGQPAMKPAVVISAGVTASKVVLVDPYHLKSVIHNSCLPGLN